MAKNKKKKKKPSHGSSKIKKGIMALVLVGVAVTGYLYEKQKTQKFHEPEEVKEILHQLHQAQFDYFQQNQTYSQNFQEIWNGIPVETLKHSRYAYGFQRVCVGKESALGRSSNTLDDHAQFQAMTYHDDFYRIEESVLAFFDLEGDTVDCLDPKEGFLAYAVGNRGDDVLDIWIINHEKTMGNIRPTF